MKAAVYDVAGGPEVLRYAEIEDPVCADEGVVIEVEAISIEGGDLIHRAMMPPPHPAYVVGYAAAGRIVAVGGAVRHRRVGQRVTSFDMAGSHAALRAVPAAQTWLVPEGLDAAAAAALPISFGTAHHCLFARGALRSGQTVLVQAGAGGVGLAAIQLAHQAGARVLATVSGETRAARLRELGLAHAIDHRKEDVAAEVKRLTDGLGADLVVDPVGSTLAVSLAALKPEGRLVFVGNAGGSALTLDLWPALQANQSLFGVFMGPLLTRPEVYQTVDMLLHEAASGRLPVEIARRFPLAEAVGAHRHAREGQVVGRVVMIP
ncbi:NADP-dependent quinone oxidoreductase [Cystobacter fuscus DSM 2262]|uniref:NADP-dependent quinone oxidoreductase n=1 Tax=Cystobacter fuscus (strain ATCC 25194 / DSM 2262 / NBRC 100088 / M29) TaxID=1242864 RepID=S9PNA6_CYSF2|nr:zinc-binding alcohol dehydrogenase family protein [Cystobacter fuscus]EPX63957.1 NADP-dependent quinone oxidoreductase [Cystobacter fuscus DSM 2262]